MYVSPIVESVEFPVPFFFAEDQMIEEMNGYNSLLHVKDDAPTLGLFEITKSEAPLSEVLKQNLRADWNVLSEQAKRRIYLIKLAISYETGFRYAGTKTLLTFRPCKQYTIIAQRTEGHAKRLL